MNTDYANQIILKAFNYLVQDIFTHNFIYDDRDVNEGLPEIYTGDLDTTLQTFEISPGDLRTLIEEFENFFGINLNEEKYWAEGHNCCPVSRDDASYNPSLGMKALIEADIQLQPELTFREIFNDVRDSVMQKLQ